MFPLAFANSVAVLFLDRGGRRRLQHFDRHGYGEHRPAAIALAALVAIGLIVAWLLWRRSRSVSTPATVATQTVDPAITHLRSRYANGEIEQADFLQRMADLSGQSARETET
jgi:hypothetical protein